ncbi:MAG TPA: DciA family protein [Allosphingosinicella sp.]
MGKSGGSGRRQPEAPQRSLRARSVSDLLPDVGRAAFRRFGFVQSSIVSRWREIVGERYAGVSSPESIRFPPGKRSEGVLTLVVEGAHAPTMQHVAPVIVERVNRFFGYQAVARLAFRQGVVQLSRAKARVAPSSLRPVPADLGESLREIEDPELREVMAAVARGIGARDEAAALQMMTIPIVGKLKR